MLIKIVKGTYGHRPMLSNGETSPYVIPVTADDLPIYVEESEGRALIRNGTAIEVKADTPEPKTVTKKPKKEKTSQDTEDVVE